MCNKNDKLLSLEENTFSMLKEQFDSVLNRTVGNMEMKGADDATITLKLSISLDKETRNTPDGIIEATIPRFKHDISSVMQVKDKVSGELVGDYRLIWDDEDKKYVMRKIDNGQTSMFEDDEPCGRFVDADYKVMDDAHSLPEGQRGLPAPADDDKDEADEDEEAEEAIEEAEEQELDESTPFGWLAQFIGDEMRVTEAMGNYTVRTKKNNVVLSSATDPKNPFYCDAEKLKDHVQHDLICAGYSYETEDTGTLVAISIECTECGEALFTLVAPGATEEQVSKAMDCDAEEEPYEYEDPEE